MSGTRRRKGPTENPYTSPGIMEARELPEPLPPFCGNYYGLPMPSGLSVYGRFKRRIFKYYPVKISVEELPDYAKDYLEVFFRYGSPPSEIKSVRKSSGSGSRDYAVEGERGEGNTKSFFILQFSSSQTGTEVKTTINMRRSSTHHWIISDNETTTEIDPASINAPLSTLLTKIIEAAKYNDANLGYYARIQPQKSNQEVTLAGNVDAIERCRLMKVSYHFRAPPTNDKTFLGVDVIFKKPVHCGGTDQSGQPRNFPYNKGTAIISFTYDKELGFHVPKKVVDWRFPSKWRSQET